MIALIVSLIMVLFIGHYHFILGMIALIAYLTVGVLLPFAASKQSGRGVIPQIRPLCTLQQAVEQLPETSLVFYEKGGVRLCELLDGKEERIGLFVLTPGPMRMGALPVSSSTA